jgi:NAD(P)-dependent dehydrogenase (short-subunit alcohol dehydrogenase family)
MVRAGAELNLKGLSPAKRLGTVREVLEAVLYLEGATFVSGQILHVDGGAHAGKWS